MTSVGDDSPSLAYKCLDLCQTLASQGQAFTFSLTIGSTFNFSMSTGSQDTPAPAAQTLKKKKSPSTQRRDARRRKEFLKRKSQTPMSTLVKPVGDSTDATLVGQDVQHVIAHKVILSSGNPSMEVHEELFSDPLEEEDDSSDEIEKVNKDTQFLPHLVRQLLPVAPWRRPHSSPPPIPHPLTVSTSARLTPCVICTAGVYSPNEIIARFCRPCGEAAMRHHVKPSFGFWSNLQTVALFKGLSRLENPMGCCLRNKQWMNEWTSARTERCMQCRMWDKDSFLLNALSNNISCFFVKVFSFLFRDKS